MNGTISRGDVKKMRRGERRGKRSGRGEACEWEGCRGEEDAK